MEKEFSFCYIKSEGINTICEKDVFSKISEQELEIVWIMDVFMDHQKLREHQPILFDIKGDINDIWKMQSAARMFGTTVRTIGLLGIDAIKKLRGIKNEIREKYGLPCDFDPKKQMSYPNYMHAPDDMEQMN